MNIALSYKLHLRQISSKEINIDMAYSSHHRSHLLLKKVDLKLAMAVLFLMSRGRELRSLTV